MGKKCYDEWLEYETGAGDGIRETLGNFLRGSVELSLCNIRLVMVCVLILFLFALSALPALSVGYEEVLVTDKERTGGSSGKYLVFTKDEVFTCKDALIFMKFNSSDVYSRLERGKSYRVKVAGWRIPVLSSYRNIISIENNENTQKSNQ